MAANRLVALQARRLERLMEEEEEQPRPLHPNHSIRALAREKLFSSQQVSRRERHRESSRRLNYGRLTDTALVSLSMVRRAWPSQSVVVLAPHLSVETPQARA